MIELKFIQLEAKIMKRIILSGLSVLLASTLQMPSAKAEFTTEPYQLQPVNLVYLGYQGYFQKEGIPSNASFIAAIQSGEVTATTLVQSAIEENRLPSSILNDMEYLNNVQGALTAIDHD
jgi:EamA domain-containing membrane protein RarD